MADRPDDIAKEVIAQVRAVFLLLLKGGFLIACLSVAALGTLFQSTGLVAGGLGAFGLGLSAFIVSARVGKLRLRRAAEVKLLARAELDGLRIGKDAEAVLTAFDVCYVRALELLAAPDFTAVALDMRDDLSRVREHLYEVVRREVDYRSGLRRLDHVKQVEAVRLIGDDSRATADRLAAEANRIAADTHKIVDRLGEVRRLSDGRETLDKVIEDLDRTARAYQEIEARIDQQN